MIKKILVPLDGSARAEKILPHVEDMARTRKAKVIFLQVVTPAAITSGVNAAAMDLVLMEYQRRSEEAGIYLAGIQTEFGKKGIDSEIFTETGPVVQMILHVAERENADIIAMASHGRGGLSRVFYGSVASGVLQGVDRPLFLVRSRKVD